MSIQPLDGQLSPSPLSAFAGIGDAGGSLSQAGAQGTLSSDAISRMVPPWLAGTVSNPAQTALFGPLPGLLQQLVQMLQQMMGGAYGEGCYPYGGSGAGGGGYCPPYGGSGSCAPYGPYGNESYFQNASGASEGDPHLSFNGQKWNSMASHPDLLNSELDSGRLSNFDASHVAERARRYEEPIGDDLARQWTDDHFDEQPRPSVDRRVRAKRRDLGRADRSARQRRQRDRESKRLARRRRAQRLRRTHRNYAYGAGPRRQRRCDGTRRRSRRCSRSRSRKDRGNSGPDRFPSIHCRVRFPWIRGRVRRRNRSQLRIRGRSARLKRSIRTISRVCKLPKL